MRVDSYPDLIEQLEYPLPILKTSVGALQAETTALGSSGGFFLENAGGGVLSGVITANSPCIRFENERFAGNKVRVRYNILPEGHRAGDVIQTSVVVMSNGGERILPAIIKVAPPAVVTDDGVKISSLKAFLAYAQEHEARARALFASAEFQAWLSNSSFEYMDIYRQLNEDPDKERALHNFFTLCGLKKKTELDSAQGPLYFNVSPNVSEMIGGRISVKRTGWGFLDEEVLVEGGSKWLEVVPARLNSASFAGGDTADVLYKINTSLIGPYGTGDRIIIGAGVNVKIRVNRKKPLDVMLDKEFYVFGETGCLLCANNTGKNVLLDVEAKDSFIRFEGTRYSIGETASIPFALRHNAATLAQTAIKKQPSLSGGIVIRAVPGRDWPGFEETLALTAGVGFAPEL